MFELRSKNTASASWEKFTEIMAIEKNKFGLSRKIPYLTRRKLRQEAGFGCVVCGFAIGQYEHIDPTFSEAKIHDFSKMAFVCGHCHQKITNGMLSKETVLEAKKSPWCKRNRKCMDVFDVGSKKFNVIIGNTIFCGSGTFLKVFNKNILSLKPPAMKGEPYEISGEFFNQNGDHIFSIIKNEWMGNIDDWDIEVKGKDIIIRTESRKIALQLRAYPLDMLYIKKMNFYYNGVSIFLKNQKLNVKNLISGKMISTVFDTNSLENCGIFIDYDKIIFGATTNP